MSNISNKQLEANKRNAKLGGVKTESGKNKSKYNAVKHNLLTNLLCKEEQLEVKILNSQLDRQFKPSGVMEELLVERLSVWIIRLKRVIKSEGHYMDRVNNPTVLDDIENYIGRNYEGVELKDVPPSLNKIRKDVDTLSDTFLRYEAEVERRLYKTLQELVRLQNSKHNESD